MTLTQTPHIRSRLNTDLSLMKGILVMSYCKQSSYPAILNVESNVAGDQEENGVIGDVNIVRSNIFNIPIDCMGIIVQYLDPLTIRNVAMSCKQVSRVALVYLHHARQQFKHFTEFDRFIHRCDQYWQDKVENGITYCHLAGVWWLEIEVLFTNLRVGIYKPTLTIRRNRRINFCAMIYGEISNGDTFEIVNNVAIDWREKRNVWHDFCTEPIEVKSKSQVVRIRIRDNGGGYIYGVDIRSARLFKKKQIDKWLDKLKEVQLKIETIKARKLEHQKKENRVEGLTTDELVELEQFDWKETLQELKKDKKYWQDPIKTATKEEPKEERKSFRLAIASEFQVLHLSIPLTENGQHSIWMILLNPSRTFLFSFEAVCLIGAHEVLRRSVLNDFLLDILYRPELKESLRIFPDIRIL
ncbi:hypothetical protein BC833DRAFT_649657 [Globomyces pollinis-pini]|nr:hypothetical protein BC833DRAFT_649657 [Globomyces pollinis-pini]